MLANCQMNVSVSMEKAIPIAFATTPFSTNFINCLYNNNNYKNNDRSTTGFKKL